jgi:hypothetical protein
LPASSASPIIRDLHAGDDEQDRRIRRRVEAARRAQPGCVTPNKVEFDDESEIQPFP